MVGWRTTSNRRWRAGCRLTRAWCWWHMPSCLWKFPTWRFLCRGLPVIRIRHLVRVAHSVRLLALTKNPRPCRGLGGSVCMLCPWLPCDLIHRTPCWINEWLLREQGILKVLNNVFWTNKKEETCCFSGDSSKANVRNKRRGDSLVSGGRKVKVGC